MTSYLVLLNYAFRLLGARPYSTAEIEKKLRSKKVGTPEDIETIIKRLKELRYLDDQNYAKIFVESSLRRKPQGMRLLKLNLQKKGISQDNISNIFREKNIDEFELAEQAANRKLQTFTRLPAQKQKEKLYRFLLSRGFAMDTVCRVLGQINY